MHNIQKHNFLIFNRIRLEYLILLLVLLIYFQSIFFDYNLDDQLVYQNMPRTSNVLEGLKLIFNSRFAFKDYRPVSVSTFYLEYLMLGKMNANFSHFVNIMLYSVLCIMVYIFIRKLDIFKTAYLVVLATFTFLAHPIHNSVVASIKNRDNLLSMIFSILIMYLFISILRNKKYVALPLLLPLFILALWSKLDAFFLVLIIPLLYYFENGDIKKPMTLIPTVLLFIILYNFYFLLSNWVDNNFVVIDNIYTVDSITENPFIQSFTWNNRIKLIGVTYQQYLQFLLVPFNYRFYYGTGFIDISNFFTFNNVLGWFALISTIIAIFIYTIKKQRIGISVSLLFFPLIYCLNIFQPVPGLFADRYAFISSLGFSMLVVHVFELLFKKYSYALLIYILYLGILVISSFIGVHKWKNYDTLLENDMPYLKHVYEPNRIAASTYLDISGNSDNSREKEIFLKKAIKYAKQGILLYKGDNFMCQLAGTAYYLLGDIDQASFYFSEAIKINPKDFRARMSLADLSIELNNYQDALKDYNIAFTANYFEDQIAYKIVDAYCKINEFSKADSINEIIRDNIDPKYIYFENRGYIFLNMNDSMQAYQNFDKAISMGLQDSKLYEEIKVFKNRHRKP